MQPNEKAENLHKIVDKLVTNDFLDRDINLTQEEIQFLKANPELMANFADTTLIKRKYIVMLFIISFCMAATAKIIGYNELLTHHEILNDLLTNVMFSVSMELLGASITTYFLEIILVNRVQKNKLLLRQLRKIKG